MNKPGVQLAHLLILLVVLFALSLGFYGVWSFRTLNEVKVNGPIYSRIVDGKDLIADILPPPFYIIESYLVCLQLSVADRGEQSVLVERLNTLRKEYEERHGFWEKKGMDARLNEALLRDAYGPAAAFYRLALADFVPALQAQNKDAADAVLAKMTAAYGLHRAAVDRAVLIAERLNNANEQQAEDRIHSAVRLMLAILGCALSAGVVSGVIIGRNIRQMARGVLERTNELSATNHALELARVEAEQANLAKSAFLATMSHEIRTPMNGVVGMVEVLAQSPLAEDQADAVNTIRTSAFSLLGLIDDILDFSKIEAGRLDLERIPVGLSELVEGVCDTLLPVAWPKNVNLSLFIDPGLPARVWSDPTRLRQVLYNLIGNAIKFSAGRAQIQGDVTVRLGVTPQAPPQLVVHVIDNGIGIAPPALKRLFLPFTQAEGSTTRRFGGTGLGLVICERLVTLMQGAITVQSETGAGTVFTVKLPLDVETAEPAAVPWNIAGLHCLVVPGPELCADDLRVYLEHAGAHVQMAADGDAAAQTAARLGGPVVVVQGASCGPPATAPQRAVSAASGVRHVLITRGRRPPGWIAPPGAVGLVGDALKRHALLRAVAAAAGRVSPELLQDRLADRLPGTTGAAPPTVAQARAQGRLILVAEDDAVNQKVVLKQLALLGYAAEIASNGAEAVHLWRGGQHALLLTDLHMPELDGYGVTETIRREEAAQGRGARLPILALTANALRDEAARVRAVGMDDYLTKPIQLSVLGAALNRWLPPVPVSIPAAAPQAAAPVVDIAVLKGLVGDDADTLQELLADYLASAVRQGAELRTACAKEDFAQVSNIVHKLKSSSRSVGALALADLCAELENLARAGGQADIVRSAAQVDAALQEALACVTDLLAPLAV